MKNKEKLEKRLRRKKRVRSKVKGTGVRPRVSVFRSNRHMFVQIIDDIKGNTLVSAGDLELKDKDTKTNISFKVGELLAKKSVAKKIKRVVFDKGGYRYQGRVKSLAEGLRKGGLEF